VGCQPQASLPPKRRDRLSPPDADEGDRADAANPLAGDPGFEPVSRGMRAALPYLDDLVAGDTFDSLAVLAGRLDGDH
jgi:uncharacterized protein with von Willebrand factor type A (vWA) domain